AAVKAVAPTFGGINLEDISAPHCFAVEDRLKEDLDIPVMHDDQHGTAVVLLAALLNALKVVGKDITRVKVVVNGLGAPGTAMANPEPEIMPELALPCCRILATGRSDYPNQVNNLLAFPGIFRGALDVRARAITEPMKLAAAAAIAGIIPEDHLSEDYIIPSV